MIYRELKWNGYTVRMFIIHPSHNKNITQTELILDADGRRFYGKGRGACEEESTPKALLDFEECIRKSSGPEDVQKIEYQLDVAKRKQQLAQSFVDRFLGQS